MVVFLSGTCTSDLIFDLSLCYICFFIYSTPDSEACRQTVESRWWKTERQAAESLSWAPRGAGSFMWTLPGVCVQTVHTGTTEADLPEWPHYSHPDTSGKHHGWPSVRLKPAVKLNTKSSQKLKSSSTALIPFVSKWKLSLTSCPDNTYVFKWSLWSIKGLLACKLL